MQHTSASVIRQRLGIGVYISRLYSPWRREGEITRLRDYEITRERERKREREKERERKRERERRDLPRVPQKKRKKEKKRKKKNRKTEKKSNPPLPPKTCLAREREKEKQALQVRSRA